jgi:cytochrome oxidase Cu insertion factor (SCO1/SenC/PrrC family)
MHPKKSKFLFWFILALFIAPFIAATWLYAHAENFHFTTKNKGLFISPPAEIAELNIQFPEEFNHYWWILLFQNTACETDCQNQLDSIRRMHLALHKNQHRVHVLLAQKDPSLQLREWLSAHVPGFLLTPINNSLPPFLEEQPGIAIMDPHGNIILRYPFNANPEDIFKDLKTLLHNSQIG